MELENKLYTAGEVARVLGVPLARLDYAIRSYQIEPTQRAGILRLYDSETIERIKRSLRRINGTSIGRPCV